MEIALKSVVIVNKTKQFAMVYGLGECVGEIKIRFFNGSEIYIQPKDVTPITSELSLAAPELLKRVEGMLESYNMCMAELPEGWYKDRIRGYFTGEPEKAIEILQKATGAN